MNSSRILLKLTYSQVNGNFNWALWPLEMWASGLKDWMFIGQVPWMLLSGCSMHAELDIIFVPKHCSSTVSQLHL